MLQRKRPPFAKEITRKSSNLISVNLEFFTLVNFFLSHLLSMASKIVSAYV